MNRYRLLFWIAFVASFLVTLANIPVFYHYAIDTVKASESLMNANISPELIAIVRSVARRFAELIMFGVAVTIALRSSNRVSLLMATLLVLLAPSMTGAWTEFPDYAPQWMPLAEIVATSANLLSVWMIFYLPDGRLKPRWIIWVMLPYFIWTTIQITLTIELASVTSFLSFVPLFGLLVYGTMIQMRNYRTGSDIFRHQFKWMLFGIGSAVFTVIFVQSGYLIVPKDYHILIAGVDEFGAAILGFSIGFAVTRYRLYDINFVLHETLVYLTLFIFGVLSLGGIIAASQALFPEFNLLVLIISVLTMGFFFPQVRGRIAGMIDRRVYRLRRSIAQFEAYYSAYQTRKTSGTLTGFTFDGYTLGQVIARGGMGEIYLATRGNQEYAMKTLLLEDDTQNYEAWFMNEIDILNGLNHPNIVRSHAGGRNEAVVYLVMDFIRGTPLNEKLRQEEMLSLSDVLYILHDIAAAVDYLHKTGIFHGDLKPANIQLRESDASAVLLDFGLARRLPVAENTETIVGTVAYLAPEQIQGQDEITPRTDIYALGVMLYELLTGELPFKGNVTQTIMGHLYQPAPDASQIDSGLPLAVDAIIQRALAKHPDDRWESAQAMYDALKQLA